MSSVVAGIAILGGLCAFQFWVFNLLEKKLESKLDSISGDVHKIARELVEERRSKDALYSFVLDQYRNK